MTQEWVILYSEFMWVLKIEIDKKEHCKVRKFNYEVQLEKSFGFTYRGSISSVRASLEYNKKPNLVFTFFLHFDIKIAV